MSGLGTAVYAHTPGSLGSQAIDISHQEAQLVVAILGKGCVESAQDVGSHAAIAPMKLDKLALGGGTQGQAVVQKVVVRGDADQVVHVGVKSCALIVLCPRFSPN